MRSASGFSSDKSSSDLSTFVDSPVSELSLTCNEKLSSILPSAATRSPASRIKISPGTTYFDGISILTPSRITLAFGEDRFLRLSSDFAAFSCCTVPSIAFSTITVIITIVLSILPVAADTIAATISIITSRSRNCSKNTRRVLFFLPSSSAFSPFSFSSASACCFVRPSFLVFRRLRISFFFTRYHGSIKLPPRCLYAENRQK